MKKILVLLLIVPFLIFGQETKKDSKVKTEIKKIFKFSTFYAGANGGSSLTDDDIYSITTGTLDQGIIETPFDYSIIFGVRKIARFGYENRANVFYDGTEKSYSDAATIGKISGFEFCAPSKIFLYRFDDFFCSQMSRGEATARQRRGHGEAKSTSD